MLTYDKQFVDHNYDYNKKNKTTKEKMKPQDMGSFLEQLEKQKEGFSRIATKV